ncbi:MAG: M48 family metallopeptidase [Candidatus Marinimicrobia bacterium]|nr:M48 family metallopeptidase [Candidatus Neomarinimicrobiota bacterium]
MATIELGHINVDVTQKNIKNIHLSVHPPKGRVTISAPKRMDLETIRVYAVSKLGWIKKQQEKIAKQKREPIREFVNRESHYFKGERYLLKVIESNFPAKVVLKHSILELHVRPNSPTIKRREVLDEWYRQQLKVEIPKFISVWEKKLNVQVNEFGVKKMKTRWGSCNIKKKRIWLNLELAKKPMECLEYVVVHEIAHLLEKNHSARFYSLMEKHYPNWKHSKDLLNRLPISHRNWEY